MSRAKNPKYESMSLEELKANMEKEQKGTGAGHGSIADGSFLRGP